VWKRGGLPAWKGDAVVSRYFGLGAETSDGWPIAGGFEETPFQDEGVRVNSDLSRATAMARVGCRFVINP